MGVTSAVPDYYAPDGTPIDVDEWCRLFELRHQDMSQDSWWRRRTQVTPTVEVSTVWLGLDHQWLHGPPLFWETMIFGGEHADGQWRYSSRQQALDDHERIVAALRAGRDPDDHPPGVPSDCQSAQPPPLAL
jgi:hypothetical protein